MRRLPLTLISLFTATLLLSSAGYSEQTPEALLLEQIRYGEASDRDDIVQQAIYRLESIDPNNPELIVAKIRQALRQKNQQQAQAQLELLKNVAPNSAAYQQAEMAITLASPAGQQQLQQARLLVKTAKLPEAKSAYDALFKGDPPPIDLAGEYWQLVSRLPNQLPNAIAQLEKLDRDNPDNPSLRNALVNMLFQANQDDKAFALIQSMVRDPLTRDNAATLWMSKIKSMPVDDKSIEQLRRYITLYDDTTKLGDARQQLTQQLADLADPIFVARQEGLLLVNQGEGAQAIPYLQRVVAAKPNDVDAIGALGRAYSQQGNHLSAISEFERAGKLDTTELDKWNALIKTNQYWLLIKQGDDALSSNQLALAESRYQQARRLNDHDIAALIGLGDVAVARHNDTLAQNYYQNAVKMEPDSGWAIGKLVDVYARQSPQKALTYLYSLSPQLRKLSGADATALRSTILQKEAEALEQLQETPEALDKLREAHRLTPNDVWLNFHLAQLLSQTGQRQEADALFNRVPANAQAIYAYALYLSGTDRDEQALQQINRLPQRQWDNNLHDLAHRLQLDIILAKANEIHQKQGETAAIAYLKQQPDDNRIDLQLADWAQQRGDYRSALSNYQHVQQRDPTNQDALLGEAESYAALGEKNSARNILTTLEKQPNATPNAMRRIANVWSEIGESQHADTLYQSLRQTMLHQPPSSDNALIWRDMARFERANHQPQQALDDYRQAILNAGMTHTLPLDNEQFTQLTRNTTGDDWLKRSIRSDAGDLYQQQNTTVTLDYDYWINKGTNGLSNVKANTTMLELDTPLYNGKAFGRIDMVNMNVGAFSPDSSGYYYQPFGTCNDVGCNSGYSQKKSGTSFALGWQNKRWYGDIGTTPIGFEVVDWVGGLSYKTDLLGIGWTLGASRRPITSSLLSFSGTVDPNTGIRWGGVRATGASLSMSYDKGLANGVWADLSAHQYTGKNVENNQGVQLMGGYYYRVVNQEDLIVTVGLNSMLWHYQKYLDGYSLGQGGYYSPQSYFSLGIPVNYRQRTDNWSWELGGSVARSTATTKDERRYPIRSLIPDSLPDIDAIETGSRSSGLGYSARGVVERRLTSHWSLGAGIDYQYSQDYTPSHAFIYLRYNLNGWRGNMDMPLKPLTPYAEFK